MHFGWMVHKMRHKLFILVREESLRLFRGATRVLVTASMKEVGEKRAPSPKAMCVCVRSILRPDCAPSPL